MTLRTVRLELARGHDFPEGSSVHGYEFIAPLDPAGHLDAREWKESRDKCTVRRFWGAAPEERGSLVHAGGKHWIFSYVPDEEDDDEPIFKLDRHVITQGEYVSITEHDGIQRTFRVAGVR